MAISTIDQLIAGFKPPVYIHKDFNTATQNIGIPFSFFYRAGIPGPAVAPTSGVAGAALTSYPGQIPFTNPTGGNTTYLARFAVSMLAGGTQTGIIVLADRLWHNSGLSVTSTTTQTVNSVAFPARDQNGSSDGVAVLLGVEVSSATGGNTPSIDVTYTNSANVSGRVATLSITMTGGSQAGTFFPFVLQGEDNGVRSIQSFKLNSSWVSGAIHLVAYRILASLSMEAACVGAEVNPLTSGLPVLYNDTVPFIYGIPSSTLGMGVLGTMTVSQG